MLSRLGLIKVLVFDMDGVLTDGGLLIQQDEQWSRRMDIKDGYALQLAVKSGYKILVVSGSESKPVADRLARLGISEIFMKVNDKLSFLENYIEKNNYETGEILYMGDDIPDYECMKLVGFACCPADAAVEIQQISSYISAKKGGYGCVRDVVEKILKLSNKWPLHTSVAAT
ncbi:MAG TPA: HAD hydrolase family protein [Chitinophagaceae bacterium]|nr:HAD hydrolase family protein [Chitinophagaceae bacterium]